MTSLTKETKQNTSTGLLKELTIHFYFLSEFLDFCHFLKQHWHNCYFETHHFNLIFRPMLVNSSPTNVSCRVAVPCPGKFVPLPKGILCYLSSLHQWFWCRLIWCKSLKSLASDVAPVALSPLANDFTGAGLSGPGKGDEGQEEG